MLSSVATSSTSYRAPPARSTAGIYEGFLASTDLAGAKMPFARNEEIYGEGEAAEYAYKVLSGAVRVYKILSDGRRQISAFYLPGDIFGLEPGRDHAFSADAVVDSDVLVVKRATLMLLTSRDVGAAQQLWTLTARELQHMQDHVVLLVKSARERIASFLLQMGTRIAGNEIEIPMSRQDIADYLGLTIETVSRMLTQLENSAAIALPASRRIVIRNKAALTRLDS
jgi:CRP/FNR family transcriptional regulator, nitrogen fixation regulation protein